MKALYNFEVYPRVLRLSRLRKHKFALITTKTFFLVSRRLRLRLGGVSALPRPDGAVPAGGGAHHVPLPDDDRGAVGQGHSLRRLTRGVLQGERRRGGGRRGQVVQKAGAEEGVEVTVFAKYKISKNAPLYFGLIIRSSLVGGRRGGRPASVKTVEFASTLELQEQQQQQPTTPKRSSSQTQFPMTPLSTSASASSLQRRTTWQTKGGSLGGGGGGSILVGNGSVNTLCSNGSDDCELRGASSVRPRDLLLPLAACTCLVRNGFFPLNLVHF